MSADDVAGAAEAAPPSEPSNRHGARFTIAAPFVLLAALALHDISSPDVGWQLATGRLIAETGHVPSVDVFSYTARGRPWIELRWGWDLLLYLGLRLGGPALLVLGKTALLVAALHACARGAPRRRSTAAGLALLSLGVIAVSGRTGLRPEVVTYALLPVFLERLSRAARGDPAAIGWRLPALQILWANLHSLFLLGPIAAAALALGAWSRPRPTPSSWRGLALSTTAPALLGLCCLVNPYGPAAARSAAALWLHFHASDPFRWIIGELQSPFELPGWGLDLWAAALLVAATVASFVANRRRLDLGRLGFFLATVGIAGAAVRNVGLLAIVATWTALKNLEEVGPSADQTGPVRGDRAARLAIAAGCLAATWFVATDRHAAFAGRTADFGLGFAEVVPERSIRFLAAAGIRSRVFCPLSDAGWLLWYGDGRFQTFLDGRLEVFDGPTLFHYLNAGGDRAEEWTDFADRFGIGALLLHPNGYPGIRALAASPDWALVDIEPNHLVFLRRLPENADVIARFEIGPEPYWGPFLSKPRGDLAHRFGAIAIPWHSLGMARSLFALGRGEDAVHYLNHAIEVAPEPSTFDEVTAISRTAAAAR